STAFQKMRSREESERKLLQERQQLEANCSFLSYPPGDYVAEELCIDAAKACSISPLYCSLFGLFRERDRLWFSPNHIFQLEESASEDVFFRIRYYFPGWYSGGQPEHFDTGSPRGQKALSLKTL
uniref:FERM domain-containing protein n=1 Tax=Labrus bergylta TaxID=56723 RepID=A0A3Q3L5U8_9LABR